MPPTIHATAVLIGAKAVLIRGASGAGKSTLAWELIRAAGTGALVFAKLVGDDRVHLETTSGCVLVRPAPALAGLLEVRGLGICGFPYEPVAVVGLVVDLGAADAARLPVQAAETTDVLGISLPRLGVAAGQAALPLILAWVAREPRLSPAGD